MGISSLVNPGHPLNRSATRTTEMRSRGRERAALAAKPSRARGNHPDGDVSLRGAGPDQRDEPADDRPAKKQVHNEYSQRIGFVPADDRGKEIHERRENKKCHVLTPFPSDAGPNKVLRWLYREIRSNPLECSFRSFTLAD